jgi:uncharacterized protein (TIGR04222 family)
VPVLGFLLDARGPEFLAIYTVIAGAVLLLARFWMRQRDLTLPARRVDLKDPLSIAFLRGGAPEVLRVVTFSLVDRGLLLFDGSTVCVKSQVAGALVRRPLEKAVLARSITRTRPAEIAADRSLQSLCAQYAHDLGARGLVASPGVLRLRLPAFLAAFALGVGLALAKLGIALYRGRSNIGLLFLFALFFVVLLVQLYRRQRTARGDEALADLKELLAGRKQQSKWIKPGSDNDDALLLAAAYGFSALPTENFPYLSKLFPKNPNTSGSCGSSCGSGCGGGGCGGGCGGCGG